MRKTTYKEIAEKLDLSVRTVYRVAHNDSGVKDQTCRRVISELNKGGYAVKYSTRCDNVVIDVPAIAYFQSRSIELMQRLAEHNFQINASNCRDSKRRFLNLAGKADIVIFFSAPNSEIVDQVRRVNPDALRINLFSSTGSGDITIESNNHLGGHMAAEHLYRHGHRHILMIRNPEQVAQYDRFRGFMDFFLVEHPGDGQVEFLDIQYGGDSIASQITTRIRQYERMPTAIFATCGYYGYQALNTLRVLNLRVPQDVSIMSYDRPADIGITQQPELDTIVTYPQDILDMAVYYILNRPLLPRDLELHTNTRLNLDIQGSVRTIGTKDDTQ
jgi:DNA-binding LacI/PurR family transcriptional regulator